jgi:hypothetical protein
MPYVSPRGKVRSSIPPRQRPTPKKPTTFEKLEEHVPSVDLGEVNSRDRDPSIVEELVHWKGWNAKHEAANDLKEDVDPLDEEVKNKVSEKSVIVERPQKERKLPLRIATEPSKQVVEVNEIEVNERFISDDLL